MDTFIFLQGLLLVVIVGPLCAQALQLELDADFSPPSTLPTDPADMMYSSPANDHMLLPVKVRVLDDNSDPITDSVTVIATTIDEANLNVANTGDTYDGELCMHRAYFSRFNWCRYLTDPNNRRFGVGTCADELICNTTDTDYPNGKVEVISVDGVAEFHRLVHTTPASSARRLRFYAEYGAESDTVDSNAFEVHLAAAGMEFVSPSDGDPGNITVNHPMTFTVKTIAEDPDNPGTFLDLTTGRHSALNVDLTISWDSKRFYFYFPANFNINQLYSSQFMLGGTDIMQNGRFDTVIRKQAVGGVATFSDVRITTEATDVRLNFTQTLSNAPWERRPPVYDSLNLESGTEDGVLLLWTITNGTAPPAVLLTSSFNVSPATVDTLEITADSLSNFNPSMDANFPFDTPLVIQALDSSGYVITDGPDANLTVTVTVDPPGTCLSVDSSFVLSAGVGTFMGSVCEANVNDVRLMFSVTSAISSSVVNSSWSPTFNVTGKFLIGGLFSVYADLLVTVMAQAAVELINSGRNWEPDFAGILGQQSQAHDAVVAIMKGAMTLIRQQETITADKLMPAIKASNFTGGSGLIVFDENGDRVGFSASVYNMFPIDPLPLTPNDIWYLASSWYVNPVTNEVEETQFSERINRGGEYVPTEWAFPPHDFYNIRRVTAYDTNLGPGLMELTRNVPAAYDCGVDGCGGGLSTENPDTILYWNHGTCVSQDTCLCENKNGTDEPGYAGVSCQQILCDPPCRHGECISPDVCDCEDRWTGDDCGIPLCNPECDNGNCTGPDICTCLPGYFGSACSDRCTCKNGKCNDGQFGDGTCSSCDGGYAGANCEVSIPLVVVPTVVVVIAALSAIIIFTIWYMKRMKFRAALANNDWIVDYSDVIVMSDDKGANSMAFRSMVSMAGDKQKHKDVVRNQGKWSGHEVAIKLLDKDSVSVNMQLRLDVKAMRDIRHKNLAAFVGACCDSPNVCVLMELGPKGSLDDLLSSDTLNLDWNFKYALLKDICRGMTFLSNTPIKSHGRLKASNCVVDNRWTLKITDYGMHLFKAEQRGVPKFNPALGRQDGAEEGIESSVKASLLYTAPEILRTGVIHPDHVGAGTIHGDMYSMAMIMVEILTHESPFNEYLDYVDIDDLLQAIAGQQNINSQLPPAWVKKGSSEGIRPVLPDDADKAYVNVLGTVWAEDPLQRPTFSHLLKQLEGLSPQRGDLMDNLVNMLEKYSTNLEAIVAERTSELAAEKAKTEDLVCRMLPKAIAQQLTRGETVAAETFECVTIYFSDIVGFTSIAGASTPLQVVDLLNDLYSCFDAIVDHFDVYKVETIGDAYMVVSGLPLRNGDQHAGEIASMSLHLLSAILTFTIRHMPDTKLQLRIGLHSGPVVAGVVGLKMPRYCLFGDTVNTASRMESGGLALRIHMSDSTADILKKLGGYNLETRGQREVKGKGIMTTYWLKGKEGFNRPLPTEEMAVSASQHEFK